MKSKDKSIFINTLKPYAINCMRKYRIPASVIIAMAIKNTYWGQDAAFKEGNVCFKIPVRDDLPWDKTVTANVKTENEDGSVSINPVVYRAYNTVEEGITNFCEFFLTYRVVANGPFKHAACLGKPFTECLNVMKQLTSMDDAYYDSIMALIDKYRLQDIDDDIWVEINAEKAIGDEPMPSEETMDEALGVTEDVYYVRIDWADEATQLVSTKSLESAKQLASKQRDYKVFDKDGVVVYNSWPVYKGDGCYRVRKTWYDANEQKIVTKSYDKAVEMAKKYKGYKVFSSSGDLLEDPWIEEEKEDKKAIALVSKPVLAKGQAVILDETPLFKNAYTKQSFARFSGVHYIYDDKPYGPTGRIKICGTIADVGVSKAFVGYAEQSMIKH